MSKTLLNYINQNNINGVTLFLNTHSYIDTEANCSSLLRLSLFLGHNDIFVLLISDPRFNPNSKINYLLKICAQRNYIENAKLILSDPRISKTSFNTHPITVACRLNFIDLLIVFLADHRFIINKKVTQPFLIACNYSRIDIIKLLLSDNRFPHCSEEQLALHYAVYYGNIEVVELLLSDDRFGYIGWDKKQLFNNFKKDPTELILLLLPKLGYDDSDYCFFSIIKESLEDKKIDLFKKLISSKLSIKKYAYITEIIKKIISLENSEIINTFIHSRTYKKFQEHSYFIEMAYLNSHFIIVDLLWEYSFIGTTARTLRP